VRTRRACEYTQKHLDLIHPLDLDPKTNNTNAPVLLEGERRGGLRQREGVGGGVGGSRLQELLEMRARCRSAGVWGWRAVTTPAST